MNKLIGNIISNKSFKDNSNKECILHYLEERLNEFHSEFLDIEVKVTSSNSVVDRLLSILEVLFLHGLKETFINQISTVIGSNVDKNINLNFWHCLLVLSPSGIVDQINSLKHITTDIGKCRAWIRCTINDGVFRSYFISAVNDNQCIVKFYNKTAIIRDHKNSKKIIALLENIEKYNFDLTLNSSLLNTWPNYTLLLAGYWTPALKNNPLYNKTLQVSEAIDVFDLNGTVLINDNNKSEESHASSVASFDSEFLYKPPTIIDEDVQWNLILKQSSSSSSYKDSSLAININSTKILNENISNTESENIESSEIVSKNNKQTIKILNIEQQLENEHNNEVKIEKVQSFNELLESYNLRVKNSSENINIDEMYKQLTVSNINEDNLKNPISSIQDEDAESFFEISMNPEQLSLDLLKKYLTYLFSIPRESGLNSQDFMCKICNEAIGIHFGDYFKCNFTANYYCMHCFGSNTWAIPLKILFDWDFNEYPVSNTSSTFLNEIQFHPLFNIRIINHRIYKASKNMQMSKNLRWQIFFLYQYLSTCKHYDITELSKEIWPRIYFFNNIHLYSLADLQEIYSGTLLEFLEIKIKTSKNHVYNCDVCSQKGFICEICQDPKIIYPFDLDENYRCHNCKSVLHKTCYEKKNSCPKCEREKIRKIKTTFENNKI